MVDGAEGDQNPAYFQQTYDLREIRVQDYAKRGEDISNKLHSQRCRFQPLHLRGDVVAPPQLGCAESSIVDGLLALLDDARKQALTLEQRSWLLLVAVGLSEASQPRK
ncbi:hypothetical protein HHL22_12210 [Hymenobacter sp. RP-2-7]|uniref:Uncharacterized protein n=1 Tax=Hymenobacter polaris TaxID=2682546 RepID=A0A7Y0FN03_9BACT|nr:hypothetical protein [Hymenobacter polaris]NML65969.1 hypothetical protein [Hymenobacter polaris]